MMSRMGRDDDDMSWCCMMTVTYEYHIIPISLVIFRNPTATIAEVPYVHERKKKEQKEPSRNQLLGRAIESPAHSVTFFQDIIIQNPKPKPPPYRPSRTQGPNITVRTVIVAV